MRRALPFCLLLAAGLNAHAQAQTQARAVMQLSDGERAEAAGRYGEAEKHYRRALDDYLAKEGPHGPQLPALRFDLAACLDAQGREREAEPLYRDALTGARERFGENHATTAVYYGGVADNLDRQGDGRAAEPFHRKAVAIATTLFGADADATLGAALGLGRNLLDQGRVSDAQALFLDAATSLSAPGRAPSMLLAWSRQGLALSYDRSGRAAQAEPLHRDALRIALTLRGDRHPDIAPFHQDLAENLAAQGRFAEAEDAFRRDLAIVRANAGGRSAPLAVSMAALAVHLAHDRASRREALVLARQAAAIARAHGAEDHGHRTTGRRLAADGRTRVRALTGFGRSQPQWRHDSFAALLDAAWLNAADGPQDSAALIAEGFRAAQELGTSASGLAILAAESRQAAGEGPLADLIRAQQQQAAALRELDALAERALMAGDSAQVDALEAETTQAANALTGIEDQLRRQFPAYLNLVAPTAVDLTIVQHRLEADEGLLLMVPVGEDIFAFAVNADQVAWHRHHDGAAGTAARVATLRCQVDPVTCDPAMARAEAAASSPARDLGYAGFDAVAAHGLYRDIIAPVAPMLAGARRLYVTANGPIANLPLGLLLTRPLDPNADAADPAILLAANWFAEDHAIVRLPTVAALRAVAIDHARARGQMPFIGFGAPHFPTALDGLLGNRGIASRGLPVDETLTLGNLDMLRRLPSLPGTERELNAMSRILEASAETVHLGRAATEASVRGSAAIGNARVVAFATHGLLPHDLSSLNEPGLVFTPPATPSADDDGILTASEASQLMLNADWVILSACNTASPERSGESTSLSALARAFLYAGTHALLASHWRVSDDANAALTVETLAAMKANGALTRALAFQQAQRAVRTGKRADGTQVAGWDDSWAHPGAWAPMSLISDRDE